MEGEEESVKKKKKRERERIKTRLSVLHTVQYSNKGAQIPSDVNRGKSLAKHAGDRRTHLQTICYE